MDSRFQNRLADPVHRVVSHSRKHASRKCSQIRLGSARASRTEWGASPQTCTDCFHHTVDAIIAETAGGAPTETRRGACALRYVLNIRAKGLCMALSMLLATMGCLALAGCATSQKAGAAPTGPGRGRIDELNLLAVPVAINLDATPGVDGFASNF